MWLRPYSRFMAQQVDYLQNFLGYKTYLVDNISASGVYYCFDKKILSIMVEGCNIISVAILFLAFIFAFYQGKKTFFILSLWTFFNVCNELFSELQDLTFWVSYPLDISSLPTILYFLQ